MIVNIIDRLVKHDSKRWAQRTEPIDVFCIHHSATAATVTVEAIARYHVLTKDMAGIQYHYVIAADGTIYQTQPDNLFVWHGNDFNSGLGVCLLGDFTLEHPTAAQLASARWLLAEKRREYGRLLLVGHKEAPRAVTSCPGDTWKEWRDELEEQEVSMPAGKGPFIASYQTGAESGPSVDVVAESDMPMVGQIFEGGVFPSPLWTGPRAKRCFARFWIEGNGLKGDAYERTFMLRGAQGAEDYVALLRPRYEAARAMGILDIKGPNEQHANTDAERQAHRAFWLRWIELMAAMGMRPWVLCWSSGTPPIEEMPFWAPVVTAAINAGGGLSAHHYNAPHLLNDPFGEWPQYGDQWYSCRFELIIDALYAAGVPRGRTGWYLISECGIDGHGIDWHGDPAFAGKRPRYGWRDWRDYGVTWESYQQELVAYAQRVLARPEILAVELYISHPRPDWTSFNYDVEQLRWMGAPWAGYVPGVIEPPAPPPPAPEPEPLLPSTDPFTLAAVEAGDLATMQDKVRWWTEEAVRELESIGAQGRGMDILHDMVRVPADGAAGLMYEAESAAVDW